MKNEAKVQENAETSTNKATTTMMPNILELMAKPVAELKNSTIRGKLKNLDQAGAALVWLALKGNIMARKNGEKTKFLYDVQTEAIRFTQVEIGQEIVFEGKPNTIAGISETGSNLYLNFKENGKEASLKVCHVNVVMGEGGAKVHVDKLPLEWNTMPIPAGFGENFQAINLENKAAKEGDPGITEIK